MHAGVGSGAGHEAGGCPCVQLLVQGGKASTGDYTLFNPLVPRAKLPARVHIHRVGVSPKGSTVPPHALG